VTNRRWLRHFTRKAGHPSLAIMRKPIIALCAVLACLGLWPRAGAAQSYPTRPITIVVPLAAGGPLDTMARIIAEPMRATLGQPIIIENVTGAAGTIGTGRVARAAADGYTLELGFLGTHVFNGAIYQLGYDVEKDFEPIALLSSNPHVVVTRPSLPATDLKGLIAWVRANQQNVSAGSAGAGSSTHMGAILFGNLIAVRMAIIPYRGAAPALQDVIAGQTDLMVDVLSNSLPHIQSGKIRPFAVTAAARVASAPDIPTVDEAGLPGFHMSTWYALFGPKGLPRDVVSKLESAVRAALADPAVQRRCAEVGLAIPPPDQQTPRALAALQRAEIEKWWPIVKAANIKPE
jgi:tripartite-type tricarboxylate transporter receptor subunit TctC